MNKINQLLESGGVIQGSYIQVLSLVSPAKKENYFECTPISVKQAFGKGIGEKNKDDSHQLYSKSPHLKHVVSFRTYACNIRSDEMIWVSSQVKLP